VTFPADAVLRAPHLRGARALFTTRVGGIGAAPYDSLNLALHVGDEESAVRRNRELLRAEMGGPIAAVDQVHSADVHVLPAAGPVPVVTADALVTSRSDVALMIMVADCLPVLLCDATSGVIGAAHAGRRGLLDGVLQRTVAAMAELGAVPSRIRASIGPSICGDCYEVPAAMQEESAAVLDGIAARTRWGTPALDLRAGAVRALGLAGVPASAVAVEAPCTLEDPRFFSYRREGTTGRFAGVIRRG